MTTMTLSEALARMTAAEQERDALRALVTRLHEEVLRWQHGEDCYAAEHANCGELWDAPGVWRCDGEGMTDATTREECQAAEHEACTCGRATMLKILGGDR